MMRDFLAEPLEDSFSGAFAFGDGVDDFPAPVDAIAAGEIFGVGGLTGLGIDDDATVFEFDGTDFVERFEETGLADGDDDGLRGDGVAIVTNDRIFFEFDGARIPNEVDAGFAGVFVFEGECRHVRLGAAIQDGDVRGAKVLGGDGSIDGGVAAADDGDTVTDVHRLGVFISGDEFEGVDNVFRVFTLNAERLGATETNADKYGVELAFEIFDRKSFTDGDAGTEFHAGGAHEFDFAGGVFGREFVLRDAIGIEAAGLRTFVEDGDSEAVFAEFGGTSERGGACADASDFLRADDGLSREFAFGGVEMFHGVALEKADGDRMAVNILIDAGAFAEDLDRTDAGATETQNIGVQNCFSGAEEVAGGDFLDETRNIYVRRASGGTRGVKTIEAAIGFGKRCLGSEGWMELGEVQARLLKAASKREMNSSTSDFWMLRGGEMRMTLP